MIKHNRFEKGQIIVILAVSMIALLGMTALALDGGLVYSARRTAQNSADSAALAGGGAAAQLVKDHRPSEFYCGSTVANNAIAAALTATKSQALENGVSLDEDLSDGVGVTVTCHKGQFSTFLDILVKISTTTETNFAKLVYDKPLKSAVETTVRVYPVRPLAFGNAIASLSKSCGNIGGIILDGDTGITIHKGGIHSNSCLTGAGNIRILVEGAVIEYINIFKYNGVVDPSNPPMQPWPPVKTTSYLPEVTLQRVPNCDDPSLQKVNWKIGAGSYSPGVYTKGVSHSTGTLTLAPGLYCIDGDFKSTGGQIVGENVTIVMRTGSFSLGGNTKVFLTAPNHENPALGVPPAVRGLLLYSLPSNNNPVSFTGTNDNTISGTIFVPNGDIKVSGTSNTNNPIELGCQLVGNRVTVTGTADIIINFDGAEIYQDPASLELLK